MSDPDHAIMSSADILLPEVTISQYEHQSTVLSRAHYQEDDMFSVSHVFSYLTT